MIVVRTMTLADLPLAMRLKSQAGWNQLEADWRRFLDMQPDGCFVAECAGVAVATTVACVFDRVAWLAMVLVDAAYRGRGIGAAIVRHALEFLDRAGVRTVRLDATPLGQPLYEKLGFQAEYTLVRYEGVLPEPIPSAEWGAAAHLRCAQVQDYRALYAFDRSVVATDRGRFLARLFQERPGDMCWIEREGSVCGYATVRAGSNAVQLGPCVATSACGAALLLDAASRHVGERAIIDIPERHVFSVQLARSLGLTEQRTLLRMCRGPAIGEDPTRIWASSGPELG